MNKLALIALVGTAAAANAAIVITEVHPSGSGNGTYAADYFEITNTGPASVDLTGWKMDDSSSAFGTSVALRLVGNLGVGQSAIFIETNASGDNDAARVQAFKDAWFGSSVPSGFLIGTYGGSGVGLSTSGDGVSVFNAGGTMVASVTFGVASATATFDNAAGVNNGVISTLSSAGVNGAFTSFNGSEVGSPGVVPTPGTIALASLGGLLAARRRR